MNYKITMLAVFILIGCSKQPLSWEEYAQWVQDEENGLHKSKTINKINIQVSYLPPDYLAYKDLQKTGQKPGKAIIDSLAALYGPTFLVVISPTGNENLLYRGVQDYREFAARKNILHFKMDQLIKLKTGGNEYKPVLTNSEVLDEITREIKIWVSFSPDPFLKNGEITFPGNTLDITLEDPFWNTGVNHFVFKREDFMQLPDLTIKTREKMATKTRKHEKYF